MRRVVALAGNPNTGKTSLFNVLTGSRATVGNWPGVTVERREGQMRLPGREITVVDLPGIYSLGASSPDERVAAEYLLGERPDLSVVVMDASTPERSLYLVVQLLEMGLPAVVALNMCDAAREKGIRVSSEGLGHVLGVPVVNTVAKENAGIEALKETVAGQLDCATPSIPLVVPYGDRVERALGRIEKSVATLGLTFPGASPRLAAVKLAEGDALFLEHLPDDHRGHALQEELARESSAVELELGYDLQTAVIERRWGFVSGITAEVVTRDLSLADRRTLSDHIDRLATSPLLGLPLFLAFTWVVFRLTYLLGDPAATLLEELMALLGQGATALMASLAWPPLAVSFVTDGILGGVGSVVVFFPHIFLLFAFIAVLDDSGYLARGAFVMDRIMHFLGLHGKSFIPMLLGFGCSVPAMGATRILNRPRDRMITLLTIPFMSCSARLPVFALFAGTFFGARGGTVVFSLYVLGIATAILTAKVLGGTLFRGEHSALVMELPPYRIPTPSGVLRQAWERSASFLSKAGTFILAAVVAIWALANLPAGVEYASVESYAGRIGSVLAPLFAPAGFDSWQAAAALLFGFLAKEVVVGTFGALYGTGDAGLATVLPTLFTPLSAYAFLVMTLLYVPCAATVGAFLRETGSWKWTAFLVLYTTLVAYGAAVLVYQGGRLLGFA